jgi:16S rRNA (uracil1498-N3)-methyltransferase
MNRPVTGGLDRWLPPRFVGVQNSAYRFTWLTYLIPDMNNPGDDMRRFFVPGKVDGGIITITEPDQLHHIKDVLRLKTGQGIEVFDGQGNAYSGLISELGKKEIRLTVSEKRVFPPHGTKLAIACAIPRNVQMDDIVDKLTQLGTDIIIPLMTERVVARSEKNQEARLERWLKIASNASEQSQRTRLPEIKEIMSVSEVVDFSATFDLKLIPTLEGQRSTLKDVLKERLSTSILALIGPEGDFTPGEVERAVKSGFKAVSLGELVLRVDTAAIAVASFLRLSKD